MPFRGVLLFNVPAANGIMINGRKSANRWRKRGASNLNDSVPTGCSPAAFMTLSLTSMTFPLASAWSSGGCLRPQRPTFACPPPGSL